MAVVSDDGERCEMFGERVGARRSLEVALHIGERLNSRKAHLDHSVSERFSVVRTAELECAGRRP
jgi:hypothetical protein